MKNIYEETLNVINLNTRKDYFTKGILVEVMIRV